MKKILVVIFTLFFLLDVSGQAVLKFEDGKFVVHGGLKITLPRSFIRFSFQVDPVEAAILSGKWKAPAKGKILQLNDTLKTAWEPVQSDQNGWFEGPGYRNGWVYVTVESNKEQIVLLEGMGHTMVYINGVPRIGNKYQSKDQFESWEPKFNFSLLPVQLKKGENEFLFNVTRGRLKVQFHEPDSETLLNVKDNTFPDLLLGEELDSWGAIVVINASNKTRRNLKIRVSGEGIQTNENEVGFLQAFSVKKVAFRIIAEAHENTGTKDVQLDLLEGDHVMDGENIQIRIVGTGQTYKRTFLSSIDESVQYYAVNPISDKTINGPPALVLSVHGANVEALNQANSYNSKSWANIVSPTNRRPYGYDWEDWGRIDALEALDRAKQELGYDPARVYLTGHSMGGHGTWILGATYPDKFAAIGPSAGWISWWSYAQRTQSRDLSPMETMLQRGTLPYNTFALETNFKQHGIYIIHGDQDRSVPVGQAHLMIEHLKEFHEDYMYHEEPGAGHWWDNSDEAGTDCVDWAPMFDFFARHARPGTERIRRVEFKTTNPGISATNNWVGIETQIVSMMVSSVDIQYDPGNNRFFGTTKNVSKLSLDLVQVDIDRPLEIDLDHNVVIVEGLKANQEKVYLSFENDLWELSPGAPLKSEKGPHRYGPFKDAFNHNVVLVYGTGGSKAENDWAFAKARYDSEIFWYQGNGSFDIIPDIDFDPLEYADRNVIIYGNAQTNKAWSKVLPDSPMQVENGSISIPDGEKFIGKDLACLYIYPRIDSDYACVGVVSGTGLEGMKLTYNLNYLTPGYGFPDCLVISADWLTNGISGIKMAGFFGNDWQIDSGDFIFDK